ncbi:MAG: DUF2169 domain-containing protein [Nannocystaceae bacterium]|nr:DUF2169 domain-containing protein [bacterium]
MGTNMWVVNNRTPYEADRTWVQDRDGAKYWVVAVKATFDIDLRGQLTLSDDPEPVHPAPVYNGEDGLSSLRFESDLVAPKPGTDVYVVGAAIPPASKPTAKLNVALVVGNRRKVLEVHGERVYQGDMTRVVPGPSLDFTEMPLVYERAYGGFDDHDPNPAKQYLHMPNPVGVGVVATRHRKVDAPAPNVTFVGDDDGNDHAAGFGAVCGHWSPRVRHAGTYDAKWVEQRRPLLPLDYDDRWLMCAPEDQQFTPHLRGGESIEIVGMHPDGPLSFALPKLAFGFVTRFETRSEPVHHRGTLSTVAVEPNRRRMMMTWTTSLPCGHDEMDYLDETVIRQKRIVGGKG